MQRCSGLLGIVNLHLVKYFSSSGLYMYETQPKSQLKSLRCRTSIQTMLLSSAETASYCMTGRQLENTYIMPLSHSL